MKVFNSIAYFKKEEYRIEKRNKKVFIFNYKEDGMLLMEILSFVTLELYKSIDTFN